MIPRIKSVKPLENYVLNIIFDDGKEVLYDVKDDMQTIPSYASLKTIYGLFQQVKLDQSRTCIYWNDYIDYIISPNNFLSDFFLKSNPLDSDCLIRYLLSKTLVLPFLTQKIMRVTRQYAHRHYVKIIDEQI